MKGSRSLYVLAALWHIDVFGGQFMIKFFEVVMLVLSVLADVCSVGYMVYKGIRRVVLKKKEKAMNILK